MNNDEKVSLEEMLSELNARDNGDYYTVTCPVCGKHEAFVYKDSFKKGRFLVHCNRMNKCGEKTDLSSRINFELNEPGHAIHVDSSEISEQKWQKAREEVGKNVTEEGRIFLEKVVKNSNLLIDYTFDIRGIHNATLKKYNVAWLKNGWKELLQRRVDSFGEKLFYEDRDIIIPIFDIDGSLCRVLLRSKDKKVEPKEIQLRLCNKKAECFNIAAINSGAKFIFLNEGAYDALSVMDAVPTVQAVGLPGVRKWNRFLTLLDKMDPSKYKNKIFVLAFDGDEAGQIEIKRALPEFKKRGLKTRVFDMTKYSAYKDCNEFYQANSLEFTKAIRSICTNRKVGK